MEKKEFMNELRNQLEKNKITSSYSGEKESESNDPNQKLNFQDWEENSFEIRMDVPDEDDFYDDDGYDLIDKSKYDDLWDDRDFDEIEYSEESLKCQKRRDEILEKIKRDEIKEDLKILKGVIETKDYSSMDDLINDVIKIRDYIMINVINVIIEGGRSNG